MKTVTINTGKTSGGKTAGGKRRASRAKKAKAAPGSTGRSLTEADLQRFGITSTTGQSRPASTGGKRGRRKAKANANAASTGSRSTGSRRTTGDDGGAYALSTTPRSSGGGTFLKSVGDLGLVGGGALLAGSLAAGGQAAADMIYGKQGLIKADADFSTKPWSKFGLNALLLYLVTNTSGFTGGIGRFLANPERKWVNMLRYGMMAALAYGLVRSLADKAADAAKIDKSKGWASYLLGPNAALNVGARGVGGITDLYQRADFVQRLSDSLTQLKTQRDELATALDGIYGDLNPKQMAAFMAAADFVSAVTNRIARAEATQDVDVAADLVLDGINKAETAQGLLAGLTAGIAETPAPAQQAAAAQQVAVAQQAAASAAAAQQAAVVETQRAQQMAAQGAPAAQQAAQQQRAAAAQQAAVAQTQRAQQIAATAQQSVAAAQQSAQTLPVTNDQGQPQEIVLDRTVQTQNSEIDAASPAQMRVQTAQGAAVSGSMLGQWAMAISEAGRAVGANINPAQAVADYLSQIAANDGWAFTFGNGGPNYANMMNAGPANSMNAFTARTGFTRFPYNQGPNAVGSRPGPTYGNWGATSGGLTAGGRGTAGAVVPVAVNGRVMPMPVGTPDSVGAAHAMLAELGLG